MYTDCARVLDNLLWIIQAKRVGLTPTFHDHHDLWNQVWKLVYERDLDCVRASKVKAHQTLAMVSCERERWMTVMNDKADKLAKACLKRV